MIMEVDVMNGKKLLPLLFVFCLFLGGPILFVSSQAYARCCPCGMCQQGCICGGQSYCFWCGAPQTDPEADLSTPLPEVPSVDVDLRGVQGAVLSSATDRVLTQIDQSYGRKNIAMRLLESEEGSIKLWCPQKGNNSLQNSTLAFQVKADTEE